MLPLITLLVALIAASNVQAKAVFAHFMVGNTEFFDVSKWTANIQLAQAAHIDAFALNIAYGWANNEQQIQNAFTAAASQGFKLFFSFDYAGGDKGWPLEDVRSYIRKYGGNAAHYRYNGVPLVSTFEGPKQADDWKIINSGDTSCFFIPDWSSVGAGPAVAAGGGVANGLFSWAAWPTGQLNTTTYVDASYQLALSGKPYMMPVSPWFFTNMPGFDKNWLWNSGDLWYQRWQQIISLDFEPEFLQIISWNDYGESHYIGPLDSTEYEAFDRGKSPYNYVDNMPHDGWREHLPYVIDLYKTGTASFTKESLVVWFRTSLAGACADGETTGNTASQLQYEYSPLALMPDRLYFSALLASYAELRVSYGGTTYQVKAWDLTPDGGVGIYHTSIPISTTSGSWRATVVRNGATVIDYEVPQGVSGSCPSGLTNWNPWVGSKQAAGSVSAQPPRTISRQECIEGWAPDNFLKICQFTCSYGYCPSGACVCLNKGQPRTKPEWKGITAYPANGDANYGGLCNFACNLGFCPSYACSLTETRLYIPETSPFNPVTCTAGQGAGSTSRLCTWACRYGYCPRHACTCTSTGPLRLPPDQMDVGKVTSNFGSDYGLCSFTCTRGFCPSPECRSEKGSGPDGGASVGTVVAYFQASRLLSRSCDKRAAGFVPTDSVTHVNVASIWIDADSFAVYPGRGFDIAQIQEFVNLKQQASGLRIWISVGGWDFSKGIGAAPAAARDVFGHVASTPANRARFISGLATFMRQWALDGVDIDWEWPGAADTANYALLVQEMRLYFDANQPAGLGWGISFTAPVDTAILASYDLATMAASANFVNLAAYDLTSTDTATTHSVSDQRRFDAALALFSKAGVPTSRINLGLAFFGRSYTLSSTSCSSLGCPASGRGVVGSCTGTPSFMSYREIDDLMSRSGIQGAQRDNDAGTNHITYGDKQWISFETPDSITDKIKYVKSKGLLGVAVWSVELDNDPHDLLNATLYPVGLGSLADHTGAGGGSRNNYDDITVSSCTWSSCSTLQRPFCGAGQQVLTVDRCDAQPGTGAKRYKSLCCPLDKTPDPDFCEWKGFTPLGFCTAGCPSGYVGMADDNWIVNSGGEGHCFFGQATYCCKVEQTGPALCQWENRCVSLGVDERPPDERVACSSGSKFVTYAKGIAGGPTCQGDASVNLWVPYCCDTAVDTSSFEWAGAKGQADNCPTGCDAGKTMISTADLGGGADCYWVFAGIDYDVPPTYFYVKRPLCVDPNALRITVNTLPVPLKNLFPTPGPDSDKQKWKVELDPSMGGADPTPESSTDPDDNSFGWYIMSGPLNELVSFSKRDGTHWELFDCPTATADHDRRHTVRAVCMTEGSQDSNCGDIYLGDGVTGTVVEMPPSCGPGKYAMAVSLERSENQTMPSLPSHGDGNGAPGQVYDFTFDFDFSPLQRRAKSNVLLRIDYSDDPHYWDTIVAAAPTRKRKRSLSDIRAEVKRDHGGSYKRYLDHLWQEDKRETPAHELHELHARWFSGSVADWITKMGDIDANYDLVRHRVDETVRWTLVDETVQCGFDNGVTAAGRFRAWADLIVNVETSAMVSLIGNLGDLSSFDESHVLFRNRGSVKASFNLDALATVSFMTGPMELFGLQNFGATFSVPGIVTIGPNFRVLGSVDGTATLHGEARVDIDLAKWDYTQQYPDKNNGGNDAFTAVKDPYNPSAAAADPDDPVGVPRFYYDVDARGQLTVTVTPQITLGIVFASSDVPDASVCFFLLDVSPPQNSC
jgi:chitinase